MKQDSAENRFRELVWRRDLTDSERAELRAWLAAHPDAGMDWEVEERLSALLSGLPDAPLSSNFTARVVQAVERDSASRKPGQPAQWSRWFRSLLPRVAVTAVVVASGLFGYHRYQVAQRAEVVQSLVAVSEVESLPGAAFLEDFDAISKMGRPPHVDEELLALMQ